jgi:hypothetical protein
MPQNLLAGKGGSVLIGATPFSFGKWEQEMHAKMVPVPNFVSAPYEVFVVGLFGSKLNISGPYDGGNMPFSVGTSYVWILGVSASITLTVTAIVDSIKLTTDVEGAALVVLTVTVNGPFVGSIV